MSDEPTKSGECPKCKSLNVGYGAIEFAGQGDGLVYYPFECKDCGCKGKEWYSLHYVDSIIDGEEN